MTGVFSVLMSDKYHGKVRHKFDCALMEHSLNAVDKFSDSLYELG